jgi:multicomponent Na+:H+ antiporter subunit D
MMVPAAALVTVGMAITIIAGPLFGVTDRAAGELRERSPYIEAVFPNGVP